jgi:CRISPR-associated protein (TIGR02710 family)
MAQDQPVKALAVAFTDDSAAAVYSINRLQPDALCFVLPEPAKALVESSIQPQIAQMPRRWDWITLSDAAHFPSCYQTLAQALPAMLKIWEVQAGELVLDVTGATAAMSSSLMLVSRSFTSRVVALVPEREGREGDAVSLEGRALTWTHINPWDQAAAINRQEACDLFNREAFVAAAAVFKQLETRVSGGQKPIYRALFDLAEGYDLWERFHYRQAWDKLKISTKALEMASVWGGPPGIKGLLAVLKANAGFLEKLVLDPSEVKELVALDLLAHARRRLDVDHDSERAMIALARALEAFAQRQLFKQYKIKNWDVQPEQLPQALQETCRTCYLEDLDGKYKLPLQAQFRALAGFGDQLGQSFLRDWPTMKPLLDAANHAVLGHGFEPIKAERVQQLYQLVIKLTGVQDSTLPKFPLLSL